MGVLRIGVLGAGIIGLNSALELQREFPTASVTVLADKFNEETTSNGAAGIFRPSTSFMGPSLDVTSRWIEDSYAYYNELSLSAQAGVAGVGQVSGYVFSSTSPDIVRNHYLEHVVPVYRMVTADELTLCPGNWKYGSFFTTILTECHKFLPWALQRFEQAGGHVTKKTVASFNDVAGDFDLIVNCLGLQAKYLCSDHKMVPLRGQIIKVNAPWIKTFFYADWDTYILPCSNGITLGGCRQYESYDLNVSQHDKAAIYERCTKLVPSLTKAEVIRDWVGLRPHRSSVRVEPEIINTSYKKLQVVHNYGHGGYGVTAAPGTAKYAVKLVRELHAAGSKNSKL